MLHLLTIVDTQNAAPVINCYGLDLTKLDIRTVRLRSVLLQNTTFRLLLGLVKT